MVATSTLHNFEEADVLKVAVPLVDRCVLEGVADLASLRTREAEPNETVSDHVREAASPLRVEELPSSRRAAAGVTRTGP